METFNRIGKLALLLVCAILIAVGLVALGRQYDLNKGEWASWVQAIGSMVALAIPIVLLNRQLSEQRTETKLRDKQARANKLLQSLMLLHRLRGFLTLFEQDLNAGRFEQLNFELTYARLSTVGKELESFEYSGLREDEALCVANLTIQLQSLTELVRITRGVAPPARQGFVANIQKTCASINAGVQALSDSYKAATGINPFPDPGAP